jgi:hypothetical protein
VSDARADRPTDAQVVDHLLAGGEILASQVPEASLWSPEKRLAAAVLASALVSVRDHYGRPSRRHEVAADLAWIVSDDVAAPFCFLRLCDVFGLDPAWVRENVDRWRRTEPSARVPFSLHRHAA